MDDRGARQAVIDHFRWEGGHADVWALFADPDVFRVVIEGLVAPWRDANVTKVVGIESRGFLLGGACAIALGVGFVAVRKAGGQLPGAKVEVRAPREDYRQQCHHFWMQRVLDAEDRVLLVDDWAERGSQAEAAARLVGECGATFLGVSLVVDQLRGDVVNVLGRVTSLVSGEDLGSPDQ